MDHSTLARDCSSPFLEGIVGGAGVVVVGVEVVLFEFGVGEEGVGGVGGGGGGVVGSRAALAHLDIAGPAAAAAAAAAEGLGVGNGGGRPGLGDALAKGEAEGGEEEGGGLDEEEEEGERGEEGFEKGICGLGADGGGESEEEDEARGSKVVGPSRSGFWFVPGRRCVVASGATTTGGRVSRRSAVGWGEARGVGIAVGLEGTWAQQPQWAAASQPSRSKTPPKTSHSASFDRQ